MAHVISIDANWDQETQCGYTARRQFFLDRFASQWPHHTLKQFVGAQAIQPDIADYITGSEAVFVTGMGHGDYNRFRGYQDRTIWSVGQGLLPLHGMIVHLLSCQTGGLLGRSMVEQGVNAFWGYTVEFKFPYKSADVFLGMDCIIDRGILV